MKEFPNDKIRNICLAGQRGAGKTSLADAIAFVTGVNSRIGSVDEGTSLFDHGESELSRKTSISSKLLACVWKNEKINLLDCPGHLDFMGEFLSALHVSDSVGFVIDATSGVEIGAKLQWRRLPEKRLARFFFVNKMEKENADWKKTLQSIKDAFGKQAVAVQMPIGQANDFAGIVDLLHMKAYNFDNEGNRKEVPIPDSLKADADTEREKLIEVAAESDDTLLEKYFEDGTLSDDDIRKGLAIGIVNGKLFPVLFGSAKRNIGVKVLLDFITEELPPVCEVTPPTIYKTGSEDELKLSFDTSGSAVAFVYKTMAEGHLGEMSYFRTISGVISPGMELSNQQTRSTERITQIFTFQGKNRTDISSVPAGDIGVLVKLKNTHTGNTLCPKDFSATVKPVSFPVPVMDVAVTTKSKGEEDKLATAFHRLGEEDPTFKLVADPALQQQVLYAQGSTQIEVLLEKIKNQCGVEVELKKPKIPYRETIRGKSANHYRHKKQSGGRGQFGDVHIRLEANARGAGFEFVNEIKGGSIPSKFIPAVEKGVIEQMQKGGLAGSQVVDVKVTLYDGQYHDVDSSDMAFKIAGSMAFKGGFMESKPVLLEPIFELEVHVPDEFTGDVMGDLSSRRAKIAGMDPDGSSQCIRATVPQAELYKYSVDLRSMTQGQGFYSLNFSHYEEVPHDAAQKVIDEAKTASE